MNIISFSRSPTYREAKLATSLSADLLLFPLPHLLFLPRGVRLATDGRLSHHALPRLGIRPRVASPVELRSLRVG